MDLTNDYPQFHPAGQKKKKNGSSRHISQEHQIHNKINLDLNPEASTYLIIVCMCIEQGQPGSLL